MAPAEGRSSLQVCSELELRVALLFNVGTASLHLDDCSQAERVLEEIPKQFSLVTAREFSGEDLSRTAIEVLMDNLDLQTAAELPSSLACMADAYVDTRPGDRYDVVYDPAEGLAMYLNDELLRRCPDQGDGEKFFMIWFGEEPFHPRLRDGLLERALEGAGGAAGG
ncbi:chalcone isomerase family protein [Wenzhouxiangella marina]|uniref:Uncharacterized protein n=1 Tax=Wenzhouxiangella marina TaxID=1579979 RepID=A0A0K0XXM2_9GAMM|nr:chalcone isomerase family protein [Wenzhouxiangella marina]AKS42425.1 hypothetical protein WM2015_2060 [Wenzhouxiangella marina]MBB6085801.1 hypothetical protein [Wenzhouxiangella marina]